MRPDGFVLAGGRSVRMGVDKARVPFPGTAPMALHVAGVLGEVCGRVALVRRSVADPLGWPDGVEIVCDAAPEGDAHPLWGVAAALDASRTEIAVLASCDLAWLEPSAIAALVRAAPAVAESSTGIEPMLCALPRSWAAEALDAARSQQSARSFVADCARVRLADAVLRDLDRWEDAGRSGPIRALLDGLSWLDAGARDRVVAGERARLARVGVVDPEYG